METVREQMAVAAIFARVVAKLPLNTFHPIRRLDETHATASIGEHTATPVALRMLWPTLLPDEELPR